MFPNLDYFLASKGADGFYSLFSELTEDPSLHLFILKGTAGCGKSTLMKKSAKRAAAKGAAVELIRCASDPASLDAVICRELGFAIADGTPPHVIEPKYACLSHEVISLYDCVDRTALSPFENEIMQHTQNCDELHKKASQYVEAAARLYRDELREAEAAFSHSDIADFVRDFSKKMLPVRSSTGILQRRIAGAATPEGMIDFIPDIAEKYAQRIAVRDRGGAISDLLLRSFAQAAKQSGHTVSVYLLPFARQNYVEAVAIDALSLILFSDGFPTHREVAATKGIRASRFSKDSKDSERRIRSRFRRRAAAEMLGEACALLREAKETHDKLEEQYAFSVNFAEVDRISTELFLKLGIE